MYYDLNITAQWNRQTAGINFIAYRLHDLIDLYSAPVDKTIALYSEPLFRHASSSVHGKPFLYLIVSFISRRQSEIRLHSSGSQ